MAERVGREEEKEAFKIEYEEYRSVKLNQGFLEYIDNDPVGYNFELSWLILIFNWSLVTNQGAYRILICVAHIFIGWKAE